MASADLNSLSLYINTKIAAVKRILQLRKIGEDPSLRSKLSKIGREVAVLHSLLDKMEMEISEHERLKNLLQKLQKTAEKDQLEVQHLFEKSSQLPRKTETSDAEPVVKKKEPTKDVRPRQAMKPTKEKEDVKPMPSVTEKKLVDVPSDAEPVVRKKEPTKDVRPRHAMKPTKEKEDVKPMPSVTEKKLVDVPSDAEPVVKKKEPTKDVRPRQAMKPAKEKPRVKQMPLVTIEEFDNIPRYMRGHITYEQINCTVSEINKAVETKYKILEKPLKSMNIVTRNHYYRFKQEETKDTKGEFFVVEADISEFSEQKLDKRFHCIISILRHCQRLREVRGSKVVRYVIC